MPLMNPRPSQIVPQVSTPVFYHFIYVPSVHIFAPFLGATHCVTKATYGLIIQCLWHQQSNWRGATSADNSEVVESALIETSMGCGGRPGREPDPDYGVREVCLEELSLQIEKSVGISIVKQVKR